MVMELPDVPMLDWFSHLLLKVDVDGEELWLDPYYGTNSVNCISEGYQGVDGLLIQESGGKLIKTPSLDYSENSRVRMVNVELSPGGLIECEAREIYSTSRSGRIKNLLRNLTILERKDELAKRICQFCPGAILDTCQFGNLYNYEDDFQIYYRFHSFHYVQKTDSALYLNPNILNQDETAKDFSEPTRIFPIMFDQVKTDLDSVTINIPASYKVASVPDPIYLENDFGEFRSEYRIQDNLILYKRTFIIKELIVPAGSYKNVKSFFNQIFEEDQKFIIIKKK